MAGAICATAIAAALPLPSEAVNRCTDARGKVTYQDAACPAEQPGRPIDSSDSVQVQQRPITAHSPRDAAAPGIRTSERDGDYAHTRGTWRGPAQFQFALQGQRDPEAHTIAAMVIEIRDDGKVEGLISETGCTLSGLASQFVTPASASLDITVKGCRDGRFNKRYGGYLNSNPGAKEAKLTLNANSAATTQDCVFQRSRTLVSA